MPTCSPGMTQRWYNDISILCHSHTHSKYTHKTPIRSNLGFTILPKDTLVCSWSQTTNHSSPLWYVLLTWVRICLRLRHVRLQLDLFHVFSNTSHLDAYCSSTGQTDTVVVRPVIIDLKFLEEGDRVDVLPATFLFKKFFFLGKTMEPVKHVWRGFNLL